MFESTFSTKTSISVSFSVFLNNANVLDWSGQCGTSITKKFIWIFDIFGTNSEDFFMNVWFDEAPISPRPPHSLL